MSVEIRDCDRKSWDEFVASRNEANFLNSWQWGELYKKLGDKVYRLGIYDNDLVGLILAIVKNARRGRYIEISGGPLIDFTNKNQVSSVFGYLRKIAKENNCVFVRVRPQLADSDEIRGVLKKNGLIKAPMHLNAENTSIIDLSLGEEDILSNMRQQTRYEVRRADKLGIEVSVTSDIDDIYEFHRIQLETASRQDFIPPSQNFIKTQLEAFGSDLKIYKAKKDGKLLAMSLIVTYGLEADYYEGAGTLDGRNLPGAYAIQWRAIKDAKSAGLIRYNFWGIAPGNRKKHRYSGVTTFKRGFGGKDVNFVPAHDLVVDKLRYSLNWVIEITRKKVRGL